MTVYMVSHVTFFRKLLKFCVSCKLFISCEIVRHGSVHRANIATEHILFFDLCLLFKVSKTSIWKSIDLSFGSVKRLVSF